MNASLSNISKPALDWLKPYAPCMAEVRQVWADESHTRNFAQWLANRTGIERAFLALDGDLGAGKTTLVRNLLHALGVQGRVKSPSYTIMEGYQVQGSNEDLPVLLISHFDFYRFNDPQEWEEAGFRDVFAADGLKLVEWPDKALALLPLPDVLVQLTSQEDDSRQVSLKAFSELGLNLLSPLFQTS